MNGTKAVSIIIPTYNRADYILDAIESVLNQGRDDYEILVIDDGSTDNTRELLSRYVETDKIKYRYQKNSGRPSVARNNGIAEATGEYVCFLDSDDILANESIEKRRRILDTHKDIAIVFSDWFDVSGAKTQLKMNHSWVVTEKFINDIPTDFIAESSVGFVKFNTSIVNKIYTREFIFTSSVMVRKNVLESIGGFDENFTISEDRDLWLRIAANYHSSYICEPLVYKRRHDTNITNKSISFNFKQDRSAVEKFLGGTRVLKGRYSRVARKQLAEFYARHGRHSWYMGDLTEARSCLIKAAMNYSREVRTYLFLGCTFLPRKVIDTIRICKNCLKPNIVN